MPIYLYQHPVTNKTYEIIRSVSERDNPYISEDGVKCYRVPVYSMGYMGKSGKEKEVFEVDRDYVKRLSPKYVKFRDGHRERYDPVKHN